MGIHFKTDETFRDDFSYRNSDAAVLRFPFPFGEDTYRYSVNIEPHVKAGPSPAFEHAFDVDEHYVAECRERAIVLDHDPKRCQVLPHMMPAQWDTLELLMESLSTDYPRAFQPDAGRDRMALDQPSPEPRPTLRLRRRVHAALRAVRIHHSSGARRFHPSGSAGQQSLRRWRYGHDAGGLVRWNSISG